MNWQLRHPRDCMDFPVPTPEDLAITLGIAQGESEFVPTPHVIEDNRVDDVKAFMSRLTVLPQVEQDAILSEFSARYLPTMMDRWTTDLLPTTGLPREHFVLVNGYFGALLLVYRLPYFGKFLRSEKPIARPGRTFARSLAARVTLFGLLHRHLSMEPPLEEGIEDVYLHPTYLAVTMLTTACCVSSNRIEKVGISDKMLKTLLSLLDAWKSQRGHKRLADASRQLHNMLSNHDDAMRRGCRTARKIHNGSGRCGLPGCVETENLKACAR
ncbi:hypothetical protein BDN72DRAFT_899013 [Pluteus cervinus]|uniref:Uncharacterized protein n=1 Tax=Pluteus cervinus TaxID=181527 RepID=A0ACD3ANN2_9AGAR|nr:hypothetical protein BDN72DRAFT_899013 [Pluteus cervinus]